jgi:excisionase family DNA binding protein
MEPFLYTVNEASHALKMSRSKVYSLMKSGQIDSVKVGGSRRFTREALERFIHGLGAGY